MKNSVVAVAAAGLWITLSEFARNEFLFKTAWVDHYQSLGLAFETRPVNGALWLVWSFLLAYVLHRLLRVFGSARAVVLAWLAAFVMMWIAMYNLQVLPLALLVYAVPLSLIEVVVAAMILRALERPAR